MAINSKVTVYHATIQQYDNFYNQERFKNFFVEKVRIHPEHSVYQHWSGTKNDANKNYPTARGMMQYEL